MEFTGTIRSATLDDVATIAAYNAQLAAETEELTLHLPTLRAGVAALIDDERRGRYFVACDVAKVVGQLMITYEWSDWRNGEIWWIQSVYVDAAYRRQGVYRALHDHVRRLAQETPGVAGLRLYCEQNNHQAHKVYRRMGMQPAGYVVFADLWVAGVPEKTPRGGKG